MQMNESHGRESNDALSQAKYSQLALLLLFGITKDTIFILFGGFTMQMKRYNPCLR